MGKGRIFCLLGPSASGKDSLYQGILKRQPIELKTIVSYTTRPQRANEISGVEYHFTDIPSFRKQEEEGGVIEYRCYHTMHGDWYYYTANDGQIDEEHDYLVTTVLKGYEGLRDFFGKERVVPIYIYVEDGLRLSRALERERKQTNPKYAEMCRRYLADSEDFSEENIKKTGIKRRFENEDFNKCLEEICRFIESGDYSTVVE